MPHTLQITVDSVVINHRYHEVPNTTPLLLIHGHGCDFRGLEQLADQLDCTTLIIDIPGFGGSSKLERYQIADFTAVFKHFVSVLDLKEYNLLGHSLGSALALALAADDTRAQRLILLNPIPEFSAFIQTVLLALNGFSRKIPEQFAERLIHANLYNLATFLLHSRNRRNLRYAKNYLSQQKSSHYDLKAWSESGEAIYTLDQFKLAKTVLQPTLLLHGDKDSMTSIAAVEDFTHAFGHARLKRLKKHGHFMHMEASHEVAKAINSFLNT